MKQILNLFLIFTLIFGCTPKSDQSTPATNQDMSDPTNTLDGKTDTLTLNYIIWGCSCPNWVTDSDLKKYQDDKLSQHCIFIEPSTPDLELPVYFDPGRHGITVTGQFYVNPDYPKGTVEVEEPLQKAKVFRYTKMEVFKKNIEYAPENDTTLILSYQAIACGCAQWGERNVTSDSTREQYYLEPATDALINADKLWDGLTLPLEIQVTGQFVSHAGYPTGYVQIKGAPEPAKVFRYTAIKVLRNGQKKMALNAKRE